MLKNKWLILLSAGLAANVSYVFANDTPQNPSWYVLPQLGIMSPDDNTMGHFVGIKAGKRFWDNIDIQIGYTHGQTDDRQAGYLSSEYSQDALAIEAQYELSTFMGLKPFVIGGIGYAKDDFVAQGDPQFASQIGQAGAWPNRDESSNSWLITAGAGLKYAVTSKLFVQTDARYFFSDSDTDTENLYLSAGIGWHLGDAPVVYKPEPVVEAPKPAPVVEVKPEPVVEPPKPAPVVEVPKPEPEKPKVKKALRQLKADAVFAKGSAVVSPKAAQELDAAIAESGVDLKEVSSVMVVGHADRTGNAQANQKLSERRAEAIKLLLIQKGLAESLIKTEGKGSSQPVTTLKQCPKSKSLVGAKLSACLAPDRRIEITVE